MPTVASGEPAEVRETSSRGICAELDVISLVRCSADFVRLTERLTEHDHWRGR